MMIGHHDHPQSPGSVDPADLDLYALDALPADEREVVDDALKAAPAEHRESMLAHIASTREVAAGLVADADLDVPPPPALRVSILEVAAAERVITDLATERARRRPTTRAVLAAAAASVVLLAGGVAIGWVADGPGRDDGVPTAEPPASTMPESVSALLAAPDLEMIRGQVTDGGSATVLASRDVDMAVITMSGLPELRPDRAYQLWLMGPDHDPIPAGTMEAGQIGPSESARLRDIRGSEQIGLTVEPAGGSPAPTGDVLLALDLS